MNNFRKVVFYKMYFLEFYSSVNSKVQERIDFALEIITSQPRIPTKHVKFLENSDGIYEIRISHRTDKYRILFFFESGSLIEGGKIVILGNGFVKKDTKDYVKAIKKAEQIKTEYFDENDS